MISLPKPLPTDRAALRRLYTLACQDVAAAFSGNAAISISNAVNDLYPDLSAAMKSFPSQVDAPVITPEQRAAIPQLSQDPAGLYRDAKNPSLDEFRAAWRVGGNSFDPAKADLGFDAIVNCVRGNRYVASADAEKDVRSRYPRLAAARDAIISGQPAGSSAGAFPISTPGAPQWSSKTGAPAPDRQAIKPWAPEKPSDFGPPRNPFTPGVMSDRFNKSVLANEMEQSKVRQTYLDALGKHMTDRPDSDPLEAHRSVLAAHPALAAALGSSNGASTGRASPERAEIEGYLRDAQALGDTGNKFGMQWAAAVKSFLATHFEA